MQKRHEDYAAKAEEDISRLTKEVKSEQNARVSAEKKIEGTEQALVTLSQENAALQSKLEETQKKLEATETELLSLKQMITHMLTAIVGRRAATVPRDIALKLKDLYMIVRQLYFGSCEMIKATRGLENPPSNIHDVIRRLSAAPAWFERWKRSSCRAGLMRGLALAKAYHPNLDPALLMKGFPQFNSDGSPFEKKCYSKVVKQTRHAATEIAKSLKLASFQNAYDANNEEIPEDEPPRVDLLQSYSKAAQTASSSQVDPENTFESLISISWKDITERERAEGQTRDPPTTQDSSVRTEGPAHSAAS